MCRLKRFWKSNSGKKGNLRGQCSKQPFSFYFSFFFKSVHISEGKEILSLQRDTTVAVIGSYCSHRKILNKCTEKNSNHNELKSYHYYEWTHFELLSRYTSVYNEILLICDERIYSILVMIYACIYVLNNFPYK